MYISLVLTCCALVTAVCTAGDDVFSARALYDLNLPNEMVVNVSTTFVGISQPVGVEHGVYNGASGVFVSSFVTNKIHFIDTSSGCEDTGTCVIQTVAGSGASGILNGNFETATISDPSRMVYLAEQDVLVVADRANGLLRYLDLDKDSRQMKTVMTPAGKSVTLLGSAVSDNNPELDIKVFGDYLYVSDSRNVYNLTGADGTLAGALTAGVLTPYAALKTWQLQNGYDISQRKIFIQTIAVNSRTNKLYVGYTYERSAIVEVPLECSDPSEIRVLSSDGVVYNIPRSFPRPRNGMLNSAPIASYALVTFPMHMVYAAADDVLYWVEVHSHMSDNKLGAVAVRRLRFTHEGTGANGCDCAELSCNCGEVDYYAGDEGTFRSFLGRSIGYKDGFSNKAKFRVPLTISVSSDVVGPVIYVADSENSAVRKVHTFVDTPSPTMAPTISHAPSLSPTVSMRPTAGPTVPLTLAPTMRPSTSPTPSPVTAHPTSSAPTPAPASSSPSLAPTSPTVAPSEHPTYSHAPTKAREPSSAPTALNGECLDVILLDEFGDGWLGAGLAVNHSGFYTPADSSAARPKPKPSVHRTPHPIDPNAFSSSELRLVSSANNPVQFSVCASLDADRYYERGLYTLEIQSVSGAKIVNAWEIHWRVVMPDGESYLGSSETSMTFDFTSGGEFKMVRSRALAKGVDTCKQCDHPKPKPKPKFVRASSSSSSSHRALSLAGPTPPAPPRVHMVPFVLHSKSGSGWTPPSSSQGKEVGTKYSISDSSKTRLVGSGSLCAMTLKESCEVALPDGDYYFRVGGAGSDTKSEVAWTFCTVHAGAQSELSFAVVDGKCIPGSLRRSDSMSDTIEATTVTMKGELLIENVFEDELSIAATEALEAGIAASMKISREDVAIVYVCKSSAEQSFCSEEWGVGDDSGGRALSMLPQAEPHTSRRDPDARILSETFSFNVVFVVSFVAEKYEVSGTHYQDVMQVSQMLAGVLSDGFQSGLLEIAVRDIATTNTPPARALSFVRIVKFIPPIETDLSYKFKAASKVSIGGVTDNFNLAASELLVIDESLEQESLFFIPLGIVVVAIALVVAVTRQRHSEEFGEGGGDASSSWRTAVFGGSGASGAACEDEQRCALTPKRTGIQSERHMDEDATSSNRVNFDSMFGNRSNNAHPVDVDSDIKGNDSYGAEPFQTKPRANRFVQRGSAISGEEPLLPDMVDLRGDAEMNVRHELMSTGQKTGSV